MRAFMRGIKIGEILVDQGVLTAEQVEHILGEQRDTARPFGELAEALYGVPPRAVEHAWGTQYLATVGTTDLTKVRIDVDCLRTLSRRQAWQFHLLPLNRDDGELTMATDEASMARALSFATRAIGEEVFLVVATRRQLREFLMRHFPVPREIAEFSDRLVRPA